MIPVMIRKTKKPNLKLRRLIQLKLRLQMIKKRTRTLKMPMIKLRLINLKVTLRKLKMMKIHLLRTVQKRRRNPVP